MSQIDLSAFRAEVDKCLKIIKVFLSLQFIFEILVAASAIGALIFAALHLFDPLYICVGTLLFGFFAVWITGKMYSKQTARLDDIARRWRSFIHPK